MPSLSACTVIAGLSGLSKEVQGWNIAERADFYHWIKGGEFIMSMMSFAQTSEAEAEITEWARSLLTSGAAALGIKRSVYNGNIPQFLLELGDWNSFPIIEMDDTLPLQTIGLEILECIITNESNSLKRALGTLSTFTAATIEGRIPEFMQELASLLGNPVILETPNLNPVSSSAHQSPLENTVMAARREGAYLGELQMMLDAAQTFETDPKWALPYLKHEFVVSDKTYAQFTFPIEIASRLYGYITVVQINKEMNSDDFLTLRVAINVAALIAVKDATFDIQEEKFYELFSAIVNPERKDEAEGRAKQYGFDTETPTFCVIAKSTEPDGMAWLMDDAGLKRIVEDVKLIDQGLLAVRDRGSLVIFCHDFDKEAAKKQRIVQCGYTERLEYIRSVIEKQKSIPSPLLGAGRVGTGVSHLRQSFEEAAVTLRIARRFGLKSLTLQRPVQYNNAKYYSLLDTIMQDEFRALAFCNDILGPLNDATIKNRKDYFDTLESYLHHGKNIADIIRHTGLHRNTITYRIGKIQEILNVDLDDTQMAVSIWVALQVMKHLGR